ncbi:MAG: hypothetical protein HZA31_09150 [Opitutae bacterium]|nr:hypothetical protein [Opitutae bacterium]
MKLLFYITISLLMAGCVSTPRDRFVACELDAAYIPEPKIGNFDVMLGEYSITSFDRVVSDTRWVLRGKELLVLQYCYEVKSRGYYEIFRSSLTEKARGEILSAAMALCAKLERVLIVSDEPKLTGEGGCLVHAKMDDQRFVRIGSPVPTAEFRNLAQIINREVPAIFHSRSLVMQWKYRLMESHTEPSRQPVASL